MLKTPELFQNGFHLTYFSAGDQLRSMVRAEDWEALDREMNI